MIALLISALALLLVAAVWRGLLRPDRLYQFPLMAAVVILGWVFPQAVGLANWGGLPEGALEKTLLMVILCFIAIHAGHSISKSPLKSFSWSFDTNRLLFVATLLSFVGAYFYLQVARLDDDAGGAWTGVITVYVQLARLLTFGLVIAIVVAIRRPSSLWALSLIALGVTAYLYRVVLLGRRQALVELIVFAGFALWFYRRYIVPRSIAVAVAIVGALWINSVGDYRSAMLGENQPYWSGVMEIDYLGNLSQVFAGHSRELLNAAYKIEAVDRAGAYDFGAHHWNAFVHRFVPGQFLGFGFKDSLKLDIEDVTYTRMHHEGWFGSTFTGFADVFGSFWYFGALVFFLISYVLDKLYRASVHGHMVAQMLLMLVYVAALESITHGTERFFLAWPVVAVVLLPALLMARLPTKRRLVKARGHLGQQVFSPSQTGPLSGPSQANGSRSGTSR